MMWEAPNEVFGTLTGYRVKFGPKGGRTDNCQTEELRGETKKKLICILSFFAFQIMWEAPNEVFGTLLGYRVKFSPKGGRADNWWTEELRGKMKKKLICILSFLLFRS